MPSPETFWTRKYASLRYGFVWCAFAWLRVIVLLPLAWQLAIGQGAGRLVRRIARSRAHVARQNLSVCFPDKSSREIERLLDRHFAALGASIIEMAMGWHGSVETIKAHTQFEGLDHLARAIDRGRGVILFSAHFTTFEFFFPALAPHCPRFAGMYKVQRNPLMNRVMNAGRGRSVDTMFAKDNVRDMIRELKKNTVIWYASDQRYGGKAAVLLPFFGVPAMTNTAISRLARSTGAAVLPYFCRRFEPGPRYVATIGPPLDGFPTDDPVADTRRLVELIEDYIADCPEQYWWIHKRFKGRPLPLPDIYAQTGAQEESRSAR